jgi:Domain of unknown function (DUF4198)
MRNFPIWLLAGILAAQAHDLYIVPERFFVEPGHPIQVGFHNGDAFPLSEASPVLNRVRDTNLICATGTVPMSALKIEGKRAIAMALASSPGEQILTVRTIPNLITLQPAQFVAYLKEEGLQHVLDWREEHQDSRKPGRERYSKYAKSIVLAGSSDGFATHEVGFPIEIVPENDPYSAKPGDMLPVRVVFKGKPAAGIQVESAWAGKGESRTTIAGRTGPDGRVAIQLDRAGLWRLHAVRMERCADSAEADWESSWASLTFELR